VYLPGAYIYVQATVICCEWDRLSSLSSFLVRFPQMTGWKACPTKNQTDHGAVGRCQGWGNPGLLAVTAAIRL
jgi:hypothetical protein